MFEFNSGDAAGSVSVWQVPQQPDKENLRKIVKAFLISEKQRNSSSSVEYRIAALESANLVELSRTQDEEETGNQLKKKPCIVYSLDDILRVCGRSNQNGDGAVSLMFEVRGHSGVVSSLSFNASGSFLASGCGDGLVNIWSIQVIIYHEYLGLLFDVVSCSLEGTE